MKRYLVTGAAGFIGARVTEFLLAAGDTVIGVDNLNSAYDVTLKHWRLQRLTALRNFQFQQLDIANRAELTSLWDSILPLDGVINLAARAGVRPSVENPWVYIETNVCGTLNLLELCRKFSVHKFVLASTSSLYGIHNPMPYAEDADTSKPVSPYAASKKAAEVLCHTYHYLHGLDVTVLRYFTVYGPAGRPDMSPFRFVQWICEGRPVIVYGDGSQSRDFTYVDDIARGTIAALKPLGYSVINLGSDQPVNLMDGIRLIERQVKRSAQLEFRSAHASDVKATWANISRARQHLGWTPQVPYEEGISRLVRWYLENREWAQKICTE